MSIPANPGGTQFSSRIRLQSIVIIEKVVIYGVDETDFFTAGPPSISLGRTGGRTAAQGVRAGLYFQATTSLGDERHHFEAQYLTMVEKPNITMGHAVSTSLVAPVCTGDPLVIFTAGAIAVFRYQ